MVVHSVPVDDAIVALAHPVRRDILRLCGEAERGAGELGELLALRQPATSQHLRVLRDAGLVSVRREGNRRHYRVDFVRLAQVRDAIDELWRNQLPRLKEAAEAQARREALDRR